MTESLTIRERQAPLRAQYQTDPPSAQIVTRVFSATTGDDPSRCTIGTEAGGGVTWEAEAHPAVGGTDGFPCSGDLLLASLAACQEITLRMVANAMGIALDKVELTVTGEWDARGTLGLDRETPVGYQRIHSEIKVAAAVPADKIERLIKSSERYCVVGQTLRNSPDMETTFTVEPAPAG